MASEAKHNMGTGGIAPDDWAAASSHVSDASKGHLPHLYPLGEFNLLAPAQRASSNLLAPAQRASSICSPLRRGRVSVSPSAWG